MKDSERNARAYYKQQGFQSPCGEVVMKEFVQEIGGGWDGKFQSPCGEVVMKEEG